jgi:uncharacterized protein involved in type VI secretion and phage assembly
MNEGPPFWGKYRGEVTKNNDPRGLGRIKAKVRDVFGAGESGWALPAFAYAGPRVGLYLIPPEKAMVWIEFERGDPDFPIWSGCFLREGEADKPLAPVSIAQDKKILKTESWMITLDDSSSAKLVFARMNGANPETRVSVEQNKITIVNSGSGPRATIELEGNTVKINGSALEVT